MYLIRLGIKPKDVQLLSGHEAARILGDTRPPSISLDLGLSYQTAIFSDDGVKAGGRFIPWDEIEKMASDLESIYTLEEKPAKLAFFSGRYYRLVQPICRHAPTVEINGIRMHRVSGVAPEADAKSKISLMGDITGRSVLDICTGLGYTAIEALRRGAARIVSVEADRNVLELAAYNPWSRDLFTGGIKLVHADAISFVESLDEKFDAVILDPPTIRVAGQLYSGSFYRHLARVLRVGGVLVHYVGEPGRMKGERIYVGVLERLRNAGFKASYIPEIKCVRAFKV